VAGSKSGWLVSNRFTAFGRHFIELGVFAKPATWYPQSVTIPTARWELTAIALAFCWFCREVSDALTQPVTDILWVTGCLADFPADLSAV
jgi:hypothetical protein